MPSTDRHRSSISDWLARRPATIPKLATTVTAGGGCSGASDTENSGIDASVPAAPIRGTYASDRTSAQRVDPVSLGADGHEAQHGDRARRIRSIWAGSNG